MSIGGWEKRLSEDDRMFRGGVEDWSKRYSLMWTRPDVAWPRSRQWPWPELTRRRRRKNHGKITGNTEGRHRGMNDGTNPGIEQQSNKRWVKDGMNPGIEPCHVFPLFGLQLRSVHVLSELSTPLSMIASLDDIVLSDLSTTTTSSVHIVSSLFFCYCSVIQHA